MVFCYQKDCLSLFKTKSHKSQTKLYVAIVCRYSMLPSKKIVCGYTKKKAQKQKLSVAIIWLLLSKNLTVAVLKNKHKFFCLPVVIVGRYQTNLSIAIVCCCCLSTFITYIC